MGWLGLPLTVAPTLRSALEDHSAAVMWLGAVALWALWGLGLLCLLVIKPLALTGLRLLTTATLAASLVAALHGEFDLLAVIWSGAVFLWSLLSSIGGLYVDGGSYGDELRLALRTPGPLLLGPIPVVTTAVILGAATGPLLVASQVWIIGILLIIVGWSAAFQGVRILHQLTQRWLIFVPSGVVVKDPMQLVDPLRIHKNNLVTVGVAGANTTARDLTYNSLGGAFEIVLERPEPTALKSGESFSVAAVMVTPSRLGDAIAEAERRHLPVDSPD